VAQNLGGAGGSDLEVSRLVTDNHSGRCPYGSPESGRNHGNDSGEYEESKREIGVLKFEA
jgi:hypothetical protein